MRTPSFVSTSRAPSAFGVVAAPRGFAARPARPAGQTSYGTSSDTTIQSCGAGMDANGASAMYNNSGTLVTLPSSVVGCNANGQPIDSNFNLVNIDGLPAAPQSGSTASASTGVGTGLTGTTANNTNNQNSGVPYNAINQGVAGVGGIATGLISATQQPAIAQTTANANVAIAGLNANAANSRAQIQSSAAIQQAQIMAALQSNTMLYVVGGVVVLGIIGAVVYFRQSPSPAAPARAARQNPFSAFANPMKHMKNSMEPHMKSVRAVHGALRSTRKRA